jgi:ribonuclease G
LVTDEIEKDFQYLINQGHRKLRLNAHPMLIAYLKDKGLWRSMQWKWYRKHGVWLTLTIDNNYQLMEYYFFDAKTDEVIKL